MSTTTTHKNFSVAISATNPCHLFDLAQELHAAGRLAAYYSGYPGWRLRPGAGFPLRAHSWRTVLVYAALRLPARWRPAPRNLFQWQDGAFDRWVSRVLEPANVVHAMPGQCVETFRAARRLGVVTVLNHATGPVREWVRIMRPEYTRVGLDVEKVTPYDGAWLDAYDEAVALADWHCAASTVVRDQLVSDGVPAGRIVVVPYGADTQIFHRRGARRDDDVFKIVFAGQFGLRKGVRCLLDALSLATESEMSSWHVDLYGSQLPEAESDLATYRGVVPLRFHGAVTREELAEAFRSASVLVLPSLEEGFGLVVPQALACGLPCVVSDAVGAADLIEHRVNGSVFPVGDASALFAELSWWAEDPRIVEFDASWRRPAAQFLEVTRIMLEQSERGSTSDIPHGD